MAKRKRHPSQRWTPVSSSSTSNAAAAHDPKAAARFAPTAGARNEPHAPTRPARAGDRRAVAIVALAADLVLADLVLADLAATVVLVLADRVATVGLAEIVAPAVIVDLAVMIEAVETVAAIAVAGPPKALSSKS